MTEQALSELRVIEWGSLISAPFCARLLAEAGAEVIKIELPGIGDESRRSGPFPRDISHPERSGLFLHLNVNKIGITLDPATETGREIFLRLLQTADICVENQPPGVAERLKLDFDSLKQVNQKLILTSITPYGKTGPYKDWKGYDMNCCALGGVTNTIGYPDREPLTPPLNQGDHQAGLMAAIATMIALLARDNTGKGTHVDISEAECWATFHIGIGIQSYIEEGRVRRRSGHMSAHRPYPDEVLPCKDGYVCIDTPQNRQWRRFLEVIGNPSWANDPIFEDRIKTADEYWEKADAYLNEWLSQHTKDEIFELCQRSRVPAAPIRTVAELLDDAQLADRGYFAEIEHPDAGRLKYPRACYQFSGTPCMMRRPAPRLGEHNEEIYCRRLGYSTADLVALRHAEVI